MPRSTTPIEVLNLSPRAHHALRRNGIRTLSQLRALSDDALMSLPSFGQKSLDDVRTALAAYERESGGAIGPSTLDVVHTTLKEIAAQRPVRPQSPTSLETSSRPTAPTIREFYNLAMRRLNGRERTILDRRWGISDGEKWTLEEIGEELGVTRERVRQIESKAIGRLHAWRSDERPLAVLKKVVRIAADCTAVATSEADLLVNLAQRGVPASAEDLRIVGAFIDLGWVKTPPHVEMSLGTDLPVVRAQEGVAEILRVAHKHARNTGAVSSKVLSAQLSVPQDECHHILAVNEFRAIADEWLIPLRATDPFLINVILLHVYGGDVLPLSTIRQAIRRRHRRRAEYRDMPVPPTLVLGEALRNAGQFCIADRNSIWKANAPVGAVELSGATQVIMEVIDHFGVATFFEIRDAAVAAGWAAITASAALAWSGLFRRIEVGLYTKIGREVSLGDLRNAHSRRPPDVPAQAQVSYLRTGVIRFEVNIGGWGEGGVVANPRLERFSGRWPIIVAGDAAGVAVVQDTFLYGLARAFTTLKVARGERVRFDFDTRTRTVNISKF